MQKEFSDTCGMKKRQLILQAKSQLSRIRCIKDIGPSLKKNNYSQLERWLESLCLRLQYFIYELQIFQLRNLLLWFSAEKNKK